MRQQGKRTELAKASARARDGHLVSLGGRKRVPDDPASGQADIVDYTSEEAIQSKEVPSGDVRAVQMNTRKAVGQLKGLYGESPPVGYGRIAEVVLSNPKNKLFHAGREAIIAELKGEIYTLGPEDADIIIRVENGNADGPFDIRATEVM